MGNAWGRNARKVVLAMIIGCTIGGAFSTSAIASSDDRPLLGETDASNENGVATPLDVRNEDTYTLAYSDAADTGSFGELMEAATLVGAELRTVVFEGQSGVGQLVVIEGDTEDTVADRAAELFADASTAVPSLTGGLVVAQQPLPATVNVDGTSLTLTQDSTAEGVAAPRAMTPAAPSPGGIRYSNWDGYKVTKGWPGYSATNEWDAYFPFTYRSEGWNQNRCTLLVNNICQRTTQRSQLIQSIMWTGGSHPYYWPAEDEWGFEFGSAMYNYSLCGSVSDPLYAPGWWLNPDYAEWATNVPLEAQPYQDVNRQFDECQTTTHELGIRYPTLLGGGTEYLYVVSSPRNSYRYNSTYSAAFQAVHNDCPAGTARDWLTHCMGLNELVNFPYGQQSATVINASRYFTFPNCARMYSGWASPIQWFSGQSKEMPLPMQTPWETTTSSFYDRCFSNDWR